MWIPRVALRLHGVIHVCFLMFVLFFAPFSRNCFFQKRTDFFELAKLFEKRQQFVDSTIKCNFLLMKRIYFLALQNFGHRLIF